MPPSRPLPAPVSCDGADCRRLCHEEGEGPWQQAGDAGGCSGRQSAAAEHRPGMPARRWEGEVLIIGGGIASAMTALSLVERGRHVTLLCEDGEPASGASGNRQGALYPAQRRARCPVALLFAGLWLCQKPAAGPGKAPPRRLLPVCVTQLGYDDKSAAKLAKMSQGPFPELMHPLSAAEVEQVVGLPCDADGVSYPLGAGSVRRISPAPPSGRRRPAGGWKWCSMPLRPTLPSRTVVGEWRAGWPPVACPQSGGGSRASAASPSPLCRAAALSGARPGEPCADHGWLEPAQDRALLRWLPHPGPQRRALHRGQLWPQPDRPCLPHRRAGAEQGAAASLYPSSAGLPRWM